MGDGAGRPYLRPRPIASHRWAGEHVDDDASRRGCARARQPARDHPHPGAVQAHFGSAGSPHLPLIMPIGYPAVAPKEGVRRPLEDMVHAERFDMSKYMSNREVIEYLYRLREKTVPVYSHSYA